MPSVARLFSVNAVNLGFGLIIFENPGFICIFLIKQSFWACEAILDKRAKDKSSWPSARAGKRIVGYRCAACS